MGWGEGGVRPKTDPTAACEQPHRVKNDGFMGSSSKSHVELRLLSSLKTEAEKLAAADGTTLNQFINVAVAEKIAALKTLDYLKKRAARGSAADALKLLERIGETGVVREGDEV
jgi:hypothetical protein